MRQIWLGLLSHAALEITIFEHRLDDQFRSCQIARAPGRVDQGKGSAHVIRGQPAFLDLFLKSALDLRLGLFRLLPGNVLQHDGDAPLSGDLDDTTAHQSGTQHTDSSETGVGNALRPAFPGLDVVHLEEEGPDHVLGNATHRDVREVTALDPRCRIKIDGSPFDRRGHRGFQGRITQAVLLHQQHGRGSQPSQRRRGIERRSWNAKAFTIPGLAGLGIIQDPTARPCEKLVFIPGHAVQQFQFKGALRTEDYAVEDQRHRSLEPQHADQAHDTSGTRNKAETGLWKTELNASVVDGEARMTGEAELETAAERSTIDGRDHRLSQLLQPAHRRLGSFGTGKERRGVIGGEQPLEISAAKNVGLPELRMTPSIVSRSCSIRSTAPR